MADRMNRGNISILILTSMFHILRLVKQMDILVLMINQYWLSAALYVYRISLIQTLVQKKFFYQVREIVKIFSGYKLK